MSSSKVRLVAVVGVLVAAALAAGVFLLVRHSGAGPGEPPAGEGLWWEDLLRFVPGEQDFPGREVYVVNLGSAGAKPGVREALAAACDPAERERVRQLSKEEQADHVIAPLGTLPVIAAPAGLFGTEAETKAAIGFNMCDVTSALSASTIDSRGYWHEISAYRLSVPLSSVERALLGSGFTKASLGDASVFRLNFDSLSLGPPSSRATPDDQTSRAMEAERLFFQRVALFRRFVIPAVTDGELAIPLTMAPGESMASERVTESMLRAMSDFDALVVLPSRRIFPHEGFPGIQELTSGVDSRVPLDDRDATASGWGLMPVPYEVAIGYLRTEAGEDVMKIAAWYRDSGTAEQAAAELLRRLQTDRHGLDHEYNWTASCEQSDVSTYTGDGGVTLVGTCQGALAPRWRQALDGGGLTLFLTGPFDGPANVAPVATP